MNRCCVIIPMYGKNEMTRKCVELVKQNAGMPCDILVVDDCSEIPFEHLPAVEEKEDRVRLKIDDIHILRLSENVGFTAAANAGILWCSDRYDYIHLLNNDTEPEPDFLKLLYDLMEETPVIGIACSARILVNNNTPHKLELYGADLIRGYQICTDGNIPNDVFYVHWAPLCSALIRHKMIREIGLLDKRMKIWCSDNAYCLKANFNDWNVALLVTSKVKHLHGVTTDSVKNTGKWSVEADQRVLLDQLAGLRNAELMKALPLDCESNTWGKLEFSVYQKNQKK